MCFITFIVYKKLTYDQVFFTILYYYTRKKIRLPPYVTTPPCTTKHFFLGSGGGGSLFSQTVAKFFATKFFTNDQFFFQRPNIFQRPKFFRLRRAIFQSKNELRFDARAKTAILQHAPHIVCVYDSFKRLKQRFNWFKCVLSLYL